VAGVGVEAAQAGDLHGHAGFLGGLLDRRIGGALAGIDVAAGQFPVAGVPATHQQEPAGEVADRGESARGHAAGGGGVWLAPGGLPVGRVVGCLVADQGEADAAGAVGQGAGDDPAVLAAGSQRGGVGAGGSHRHRPTPRPVSARRRLTLPSRLIAPSRRRPADSYSAGDSPRPGRPGGVRASGPGRPGRPRSWRRGPRPSPGRWSGRRTGWRAGPGAGGPPVGMLKWADATSGCPGRVSIPHTSRERTAGLVPAGLAASRPLAAGLPAAGLCPPVAVWHCGLDAGSCCCHVVKQHGPDIPDGYVKLADGFTDLLGRWMVAAYQAHRGIQGQPGGEYPPDDKVVQTCRDPVVIVRQDLGCAGRAASGYRWPAGWLYGRLAHFWHPAVTGSADWWAHRCGTGGPNRP